MRCIHNIAPLTAVHMAIDQPRHQIHRAKRNRIGMTLTVIRFDGADRSIFIDRHHSVLLPLLAMQHSLSAKTVCVRFRFHRLLPLC